VTAWYLLAPNTIDETMADVLDRKRGVIEAVTDGKVRDEERLVEVVVRELRKRPLGRPAEGGFGATRATHQGHANGDGLRVRARSRRGRGRRPG
jgi:hypothetical protein